MKRINWVAAVCLVACVACGGAVSPSEPGEVTGDLTVAPDADADADADDDDPPLCGLSFREAIAAYAPERICQSWVYRVAAADCVDWRPCSEP